MIIKNSEYHEILNDDRQDLHYFNSLQTSQYKYNYSLDVKEDEKYFKYIEMSDKDLKNQNQSNYAEFKDKRDNLKEKFKYFDYTDKEWYIMFNFHDILFNLNPKSKVLNIKYPRWLCYAPICTDLESAKKLVDIKLQPKTLSNAETGIYYCNYQLLKLLHFKIPNTKDIMVIQGVPHMKCPNIYFCPKFMCSIEELKKRLNIDMKKITIENASTLYLSGNIQIIELSLNGGLMIEALNNSEIVVTKLNCKNNGPTWHMVPESFLKHQMVDLNVKIKSYNIQVNQMIHFWTEQGRAVVEENNFYFNSPEGSEDSKIRKRNNYNYVM
eukprot:Mrub_05601.p1 GENE.Mrub_05601~~Mrub_05601.p1  ORF type:complete len:353 (-),score=55.91 Mrub_05601:51-1025(-)